MVITVKTVNYYNHVNYGIIVVIVMEIVSYRNYACKTVITVKMMNYGNYHKNLPNRFNYNKN